MIFFCLSSSTVGRKESYKGSKSWVELSRFWMHRWILRKKSILRFKRNYQKSQNQKPYKQFLISSLLLLTFRIKYFFFCSLSLLRASSLISERGKCFLKHHAGAKEWCKSRSHTWNVFQMLPSETQHKPAIEKRNTTSTVGGLNNKHEITIL